MAFGNEPIDRATPPLFDPGRQRRAALRVGSGGQRAGGDRRESGAGGGRVGREVSILHHRAPPLQTGAAGHPPQTSVGSVVRRSRWFDQSARKRRADSSGDMIEMWHPIPSSKPARGEIRGRISRCHRQPGGTHPSRASLPAPVSGPKGARKGA